MPVVEKRPPVTARPNCWWPRRTRPGEAGLGLDRARIGVELDALHPGEVDHYAVVAGCVARDRVAPRRVRRPSSRWPARSRPPGSRPRPPCSALSRRDGGRSSRSIPCGRRRSPDAPESRRCRPGRRRVDERRPRQSLVESTFGGFLPEGGVESTADPSSRGGRKQDHSVPTVRWHLAGQPARLRPGWPPQSRPGRRPSASSTAARPSGSWRRCA